ncbi:2-oxo-4-hydroxy-4-carboxy-5-ureidoimidazoline decarboxylase [Streptomyces sp. NPDC006527]|uniref:2-oxo-4-hydroxy-4-carboxy-5-ureidoimidazoline decarboxylase n=1 Tax=Streptomyces sp. NPDC006527 TaxID=3364749 RepID=UPI0036C01C84
MTRGSTLPAHRLSHLSGRVAIPTLPEQTRNTPSAPWLEGFNTASAEEAHATLLACLSSRRWAHRVTAHRPYPTPDALLAASDEAAYDLSAGDLAEALAGEPLPALPADAYGAAHMALDAAHAAYEARFGHAFVLYLGDTPREETLDHILEAIRSRLTNDPDKEREVVAEELRRLARERLMTHFRGAGNGATRHDAPADGT